ncbi:tetratricopeptide repeat protein, partial [Escherichia coli]
GLGSMYMVREGVKQNEVLGIKYLQSASSRGVKEAADVLARLNNQTENGKSTVGIMDDKPLKILKREAEQGNDQAQYGLGSHYYNSHNYEEAFKWFELSAKQGNAYAQLQLGFMYGDSNGYSQMILNHIDRIKY